MRGIYIKEEEAKMKMVLIWNSMMMLEREMRLKGLNESYETVFGFWLWRIWCYLP